MLNVNIPVSEWPDGAKYVAQDLNGRVTWFKQRPDHVHSNVEWLSDADNGFIRNGRPNPNWRTAIISRAEQEAKDDVMPAVPVNDTVTATSILRDAVQIQTERGAIYEAAEERSMAQIVAIFNLHHGTNLTETQGWHFMQILKDVRFFNAPSYHHDSGLDGVSYSALKVESMARERMEK